MNYQMQYQPPRSLQTAEQKQMGLFLHLSQLLNLIVPFGGVVAPVVLWQMKKDEMPALDAHGKGLSAALLDLEIPDSEIPDEG